MKITKSLAIAAGLVIGGLNASAKTMDPKQTAKKQTVEMKTYVPEITSNEESQLLIIEEEHANSMLTVENTVTSKAVMKTQTKQLRKSRDAKIKAVLTADQYRQYVKVEKIEEYHVHHNSRWLAVYRVQTS